MNRKLNPGVQDPEFGNNGVLLVGLEKNVGGHIHHLKEGYLIVGVYLEEAKTGSSAQPASVISHATPEGLHHRAESKRGVVTVRLNDDGVVDQSYGAGGYAFLSAFEHDVRITSSLVLPDESVLLSLGVFNVDQGETDSLAIVKIDKFGKLDVSFGTSGIYRPELTYPHSIAQGMAVQKETGLILITAQTIRGYNDTNSVLMRIDERGQPDTSFGKDGFVYSTHGTKGAYLGIKLDPQKRIYVAGRIGNNMAVFRFLDNGKPDTSFNEVGEFAYISGPGRTAFVATLKADEDDVYVAGSFVSASGQTAVYTKLTSDGVLDPNFNGGVPLEILLRSGNSPTHLIALDSGQIIGVGVSFGVDGALTLSRIDKDGMLDDNFGDGGSVLTDVPGYLMPSFAEKIDDKVLIGGWVINPRENEKASFWISRYLV